MSWKKYFTPAPKAQTLSPISGLNSGRGLGPARTNYSSYLPDIYTGAPNRIDRYQNYEVMDADAEVNAALDILAEFSTQKLKDSKSPFTVTWRRKATNPEITVVNEYLQQWIKLQQFDTRIFRLIRNIFKYGDAFFIRDPETQKWFWVDPTKIVKIIVNESEGKKPLQYVIKDLAPNFENLVATQITPNVNPRQTSGGIQGSAGYYGTPGLQRGTSGPYPSSSTGSRFGLSETEYAIGAEHVVHLSLSEGLDNNYPFGTSLLETIFKVFKQKELLEDAVLIYRIVRAPERLIFHIDVGNLPPHMAMAFVERVKNEINQRRIPSQSGGGCFSMDTRVPLMDGRVCTIRQLTEEHQRGKLNWAFSCNPNDGTIIPGKISWAGVTQKSAQVLKLTLDNGNTIICTPEHKFPVIGKGKTQAIDIELDKDEIYRYAHHTNVEKEQKTHTVVSIATMLDPIEVGTLTIDSGEEMHDYHTFAIEQGVFTYNSNIIDSTFNPMCVSLDTAIPLLDGRTLQLHEIIKEFEAGKTNWAYSCDPVTGKLAPGIINWAGITRKNSEVIELTFDNGKTLRCTPDHKIPVFGKGFVQAKDLSISDSLIAFNTRNKSINGGKTKHYQQVWDHALKKWMWTHRIVGDFFKALGEHSELTHVTEYSDSPKTTIHHLDSNRFNNNPSNLTFMHGMDHIKLHADQNQQAWGTLSEEQKREINNKISITLKDRWNSLSQLERDYQLSNLKRAQEYSAQKRKTDPVTKEKYRKSMSASIKRYLQNNPSALQQRTQRLAESGVAIKNQQLNFTFDILQYIANLVKDGYTTKATLIAKCNSDTTLLDMIKAANPIDPERRCNIKYNSFGKNKLTRLIKSFGYSSWKHFVDEIDAFNHKIIGIRVLSERMDVGTVTIDGTEEYHNYHTFAIDSGIFIKNSINENYFFPKSEGRGSSVETIQGGQATGEVGDLQFFTNKLLRGLRIPSSYLPTGAEDSQALFNDGRVGTAHIQELRFNKYCERLQSLVVSVFDTEFKMYMYSRGMNIDPSLFEVQFNPPLNFASYRQAELDNQRINTFTTIQGIPYMSKRFALKRFLGLSAEEMAENERLWAGEQGSSNPSFTDAAGELRSAGLSAGGIAGDLGMAGDLSAPEDIPGLESEGEEGSVMGATPQVSTPPTTTPGAMG